MVANAEHNSSERIASAAPRQIDEVVAAILATPKYRAIHPALVHTLAARELAAHRSVKAAIKATKNKLHQIAGAYVEQRIDIAGWMRQLQTRDVSRLATASNEALIQAALANPHGAHLGVSFIRASLDLMARHASSRERLPIVQRFYAEILADLPPIRSVLDVGCGLNPLAIPWMPLAPDVVYHASDIDSAIVEFVAQYLALVGIPGNVEMRDQAGNPGGPPVDLALALKLLPVLEQIERGAAAQLLDALDAPFVLVSYPVHTLGGRRKGMGATYERQLETIAVGRQWEIRRFAFPGELAFLIRKGSRQS